MQKARTDASDQEQPRFQLSLVQVLAAVLASITSAIILSKFGVAGTYVGTAIGSAVSTVGVAVYSHTMRQARRRVGRYAHLHHESAPRVLPHGRTVTQAPPVRTPAAAWSYRHPRVGARVAARSSGPPPAGWKARLERLERWWSGLPLSGKLVVTAVAGFVLAVVVVVLFQFLSGHSLSNVWGMGRSSSGPDAGCVIGRCDGAAANPAQSPSTPVPSAAPTTAPTPGGTPLPVPTATPATVPSPVPTAVATPAVAPSGGAPAAAPPAPSSNS